jgi:hypothetical protein
MQVNVGALRHDAVLIQEGTEFYILERVGPSGATDDVKMRKVISQQQILVVRYGPGSNSAARYVGGLGPGVDTKVYFDYARNIWGDDNPFMPLPEVRLSDGEQHYSSRHPESWATNQDVLWISLKNEKGETEEWSTRATTDRWASGRSVQGHHLEMKIYAKHHPYSLREFNCQDFVRQSHNRIGIKNPDRGVVEAGMYRATKLIPLTSLPAGERPTQEPSQDTMPMQIPLDRFFIQPHHPGEGAFESPPHIPHINFQFQDLPPHDEPSSDEPGSSASKFGSRPSPGFLFGGGFGRSDTPSFLQRPPRVVLVGRQTRMGTTSDHGR